VPIPEELISELRQRADIVGVIGQYVQLRQRGKNFVGLCPFHPEKTPSFNVSPSLGIYKCFGCGKSGDVFTFLKEYAGMNFAEAVRHVASQVGISVPDEPSHSGQALEHRRRVIAALEAACELFQMHAQHSADAQNFFRERMVPAEIIERFRLGYAPGRWDATLEALQQRGFSLEILVEAGLVVRREDGTAYDRFRHRVMFPIANVFGTIIGFGGRYLGDDPAQPKYINSPQTALYDKSSVLYALDRARHAILRQQHVLIVEGYMDALALHSIGLEHTVATSGTALTEQHVEVLRRFTDRIVLVFDGDHAGRDAAHRALTLALRNGIGVEVILLPEGDDPDSLVRKRGADATKALLERRLSPVEFLITWSKARADWSDPHAMTTEIRSLAKILASTPDELYRELLLRECSDRVGVRRELLLWSLPPAPKTRRTQRALNVAPPPPEPLPSAAPVPILPEELELLRAVLFSRTVAAVLFDDYLFEPSTLLSPVAEHLLRSLAEHHRCHRGDEPLGAAIPTLPLDDQARQLAEWIIFSSEEPSERWTEHGIELDRDRLWQRILDDALIKLEDRRLERQLHALSEQLTADPENVALLEEIARIHKLRADYQKRSP
jgi:DNA primase